MEAPIVAVVPSLRADLLKLLREPMRPAVPVVKSGSRKLVGVATRTQLLIDGKEPTTALLMDPNPATTYPEAAVGEAARLIAERRLRMLSVVNGSNDLVGVLTPRNLLTALDHTRTHVGSLLSRRAVPVHHSTPIRVAVEILRITRVGALPVLDDGARLIGLATDGDLIRSVANAPASLEPIERLMRRNPFTVNASTPARDAARQMASSGTSHLPVMDGEGRLLDVISDADLVAALARPAARPAL